MNTEQAGRTKKQSARAFIVSLSGTSLEWYDFAIYSSASALIFGGVFFPSGDPLSGTLLAFGTYAVGYVARPLGGVLFGRLGDVIGRKNILVWTLLLIGIATVLVGLIPSYASIGIAAPVILVLLRMAQGVGVGGEWAGAVLISCEHSDPRRRGFAGSAAQMGPPLGNLMANGVLALLAALMSREAFLAWGWRLAFLMSAVLVGVGIWIRIKVEETPVFEAIKQQGKVSHSPMLDVLRHEPKRLLAATMIRMCPDVMYAMSTVFVLTYATRVHGLKASEAMLAVVIGSLFQTFMIPAFGFLSDRVRRRSIYAAGALCAVAWPFIFFPLMESMGYAGIVLAVIGGLFTNSLMYGPQAALVSEQFSPRLRYAGSSLAYTLGGVIGAAIAPWLFMYLLGTYGNWQALAAYIVLTAAVTGIGLMLCRDPDYREDLALAGVVHGAKATHDELGAAGLRQEPARY
ncbi:MHS family MFS transporter [Ralstonia insidiosa]|uniref:MFS transporter n=1 Tax=Ralstonia insidiosa TaxID=190721 RepID=A0A191ZWE9_9RALS|nr:MFS transporter [Ralstonia insidiosa]ANJ72408.1 MFS transporter [Ralstonia insidiosa]KAB0472954.1 MHS family MFS transporter [Ralstonia insidiosa]MBY4907416.1 MHS family MFS transporter [Ralstonia insidiosa]